VNGNLQERKRGRSYGTNVQYIGHGKYVKPIMYADDETVLETSEDENKY
jgi:hypothetical protein